MNPELISFLKRRYKDEIRAQHTMPSTEGDYVDFPEGLNQPLRDILIKDGINKLYSHQAEAFESISKFDDTVIISQTASGKTLSFLLPVLNAYMNSPSPFGVFLLYPTKALSRDQEGTLGKLLKSATGQNNSGTFDGDTPREERAKLQSSADFIISNPDMLHGGILPNHNRKWKSFLSRLQFIIVDEVHNYRGAFGSHVANVFRRLLRVCRLHGSNPVFICSSATIGNPGEHVKALFGRPFKKIDQDGSPRPPRELFFVNPSIVQREEKPAYRKGTGSVSVSLIREAAKLGVRSICFCRARQEVERLFKAVVDYDSSLRQIVQPYRGGLLPNERRRLERDLFTGKIKCIISTNALELGIDIGDLDLCILSGHPGSVSSFWQQAGRVGRSGKGAAIVFIAKQTPVDQYLVHHPEFVSESPIEQAWLNAENPYIILQHLPCAAYEEPLNPDQDELYNEESYKETIEVLKSDSVLEEAGGFCHYALPDYPAKGVNLRGMTDYNIEIYCGSVVIGELDPIGARGTLYKDAIYQHLGKKYMSMDLDLEKKLCKVEPVNVDYYTEAVWENRVNLTEVEETRSLHGHELQFGYIHSNKQPKLYKKIRERSFENIGYGPITLDPFEYDTTGFCLLPNKEWQEKLNAIDKRFLGAASYGLSYLLKRIAPSMCMGDKSDIETDVALAESNGETWKSALYLYDSIEGGVGFGEKIFDQFDKVLQVCQSIIHECECESGCPACVPPLPPGIENEEMVEWLIESNGSRECTLILIKNLLTGEFIEPDIKMIQRKLNLNVVGEEKEDPEKLKLRSRLKKASKMLESKRQRKHE